MNLFIKIIFLLIFTNIFFIVLYLRAQNQSPVKILQNPSIFINNINASLSVKQVKILELESEVFFNDKSDASTDPDRAQLLYADHVKYVRDFRIDKNNFCSQNSRFNTIIFVWSRADGFQQREAIRQTWAQPSYRNTSTVKLLFVLGSTENTTIQNKILNEDSEYGDILQFGFVDSYLNCTLKSIGVLRWTLFFCSDLKFMMKTDDDILVNIENLDNFVNNNSEINKSIFGVKAEGWGVHRNKKSKWYISRKTYAKSHFPDFIVAAHLMTGDCVLDLYEKCLRTLPALVLEDVYITGILAEGLEIKRVNEYKFVKLDIIGRRKFNSKLYHNSISIGHDFSAKDYYRFWKSISN